MVCWSMAVSEDTNPSDSSVANTICKITVHSLMLINDFLKDIQDNS